MPELEGVVPPVATPFGGVTSMSPRVSVELGGPLQDGLDVRPGELFGGQQVVLLHRVNTRSPGA